MTNSVEDGMETLFCPVAGANFRSPAIILLPSIHGINDYIRRRISDLNANGYAVLPIDYFALLGRKPDLSTQAKLNAAIDSLSDVAVLDGVRAAKQFLQDNPRVDGTRIATFGFCIGGTFALLSACDVTGIAAVVNYYGTIQYSKTSERKPASPLDRISDLCAPLISHYGTADRFVPQDDVAKFDRALAAADKSYELFTYPGAPHSFDEDHRPRYRPVAAREAWQRTLTFLDWYIGTASR